jgi:hypothetical protein
VVPSVRVSGQLGFFDGSVPVYFGFVMLFPILVGEESTATIISEENGLSENAPENLGKISTPNVGLLASVGLKQLKMSDSR